MQIAKILAGVDLSEQSRNAARRAVALARHLGAEVVLAHVGQVVPPHRDSGGSAVAAEWERMARGRLAEDRRELEELREELEGQGPEISQVVVDGAAGPALCEAAGELGADLVAVGTHGRSGLTRFLLGSVAERVARHAPCSALVVRPDRRQGPGFERILVPVDFGLCSETALDVAVRVAAPGARIDLLHCVAAEDQGLVEAVLEDARDLARGMISTHESADVELAYMGSRKPPKAGVIEHLEADGDYDLVVVGSHGRRGVERVLLGSVAEAVVRHAPCSTLVARHRR